MIADAIVTAIRSRLTRALAAPRGSYRPLLIEGAAVGWLDSHRAERIAQFADVFDVRPGVIVFAAGIDSFATRTAALDRVARVLAAEGRLTAWRDERYAIAPAFGEPAMCLLERAAARFFGIHTFAAHVNGLVTTVAGTTMWLARRSPHKAIDPGLLDNLVGGGIAAGMDAAETVIKEANEEAGIPATLAQRAAAVGTLEICRDQPDGLQRETIFTHDLDLPAAFEPAGEDGEVVEYRRLPLAETARLIATSDGADVVTVDASLVILDCLLRRGLIGANAPDHAALAALRHPALDPRGTPA